MTKQQLLDLKIDTIQILNDIPRCLANGRTPGSFYIEVGNDHLVGNTLTLDLRRVTPNRSKLGRLQRFRITIEDLAPENNDAKTYLNCPDHETINRRFRGPNGQIYFCESHDPSHGFTMVNVVNPTDRRSVSERAISRTYHRIYEID